MRKDRVIVIFRQSVTRENWVIELNVRRLSPVCVMMPIANCSLTLPATLNTCCIRSSPERQHHYTQSLRQRSHNFQLPDRTSVLKEKNYYENVVLIIHYISWRRQS